MNASNITIPTLPINKIFLLFLFLYIFKRTWFSLSAPFFFFFLKMEMCSLVSACTTSKGFELFRANEDEFAQFCTFPVDVSFDVQWKAVCRFCFQKIESKGNKSLFD